MQTQLLNFKENMSFPDVVENVLCLDIFIKDIKLRIERESTIKAEFYRFVLKKLEGYPELKKSLNPQDAIQFESVLELIYAVLSETVKEESKYHWALGTPIPDTVFYSTSAFHDFIDADEAFKTGLQQSKESFRKRQVEFVYRVVLEKLYNFPSYLRTDTVYERKHPDTHSVNYYRIHTNTDYVTVKVNGDLPELNYELVEHYLYEGAGVDSLEEIIPLSMFSLEGFSIITIEDCTAQQAIENIRLALVNHSFEQKETYDQVIQSLQIISGDAEIEFGLLPLLKVNGKHIFNTAECYNSIIVKTATDADAAEKNFYSLLESYLKNPKAIFFSSITAEKEGRYAFLRELKKAGIQSYAILPVFYNKRLSGIMEIYSHKKILFYETLLLKLETVIPLLAQLLQDSAEKFYAQIEAVIKDKFTPLQPSVEWKFNEVAWNYIKQNAAENEGSEITTVAFNEVFPLYGAVDIRNSTIERNAALQKDADLLKHALSETLTQLQSTQPVQPNDRFNALCENWMPKIDELMESNDEMMLKSFFHNVINPVLRHVKDTRPQASDIITCYEYKVDEINGEAYKYRRALEYSVKLINNSLTNYLKKAQQELTNIYPCYFEKFRTDGVEYDIFTGQSLAPHLPFTMQLLKQFRAWQLQSMVEIARLTNSLLPQMNLHLRTTQLIFIHSHPIDITFRLDERRFDVEGSYNIRYEVIKKRIDKVLIKGTDERLTQPGKIAMVYMNDQEAGEYYEHIIALQQQGLLTNELEQLELDDLQGISGLKALRVSVVY